MNFTIDFREGGSWQKQSFCTDTYLCRGQRFYLIFRNKCQLFCYSSHNDSSLYKILSYREIIFFIMMIIYICFQLKCIGRCFLSLCFFIVEFQKTKSGYHPFLHFRWLCSVIFLRFIDEFQCSFEYLNRGFHRFVLKRLGNVSIRFHKYGICMEYIFMSI